MGNLSTLRDDSCHIIRISHRCLDRRKELSGLLLAECGNEFVRRVHILLIFDSHISTQPSQ